MKKLLILFFLVAASSCSVNKTIVTPKHSINFSPKLNIINNRNIGVAIAYKEDAYEQNAIQMTKKIKHQLNEQTKIIDIGEVFINNYNLEKYLLFNNPNDLSIGIAINKDDKTAYLYTNTTYGDGIYSNDFNFIYGELKFIAPKEKIEYIETKSPVKDKKYFKQEFIYNGRIGNSLKFIYREYLNDYARPAFSQDLQYDLSESNIIGFKDLRIEIFEVTNTQIKYKVLSSF
ncbi:hypothetical protein [Mesoflavibacter zeaxanthinifaciens]|uniref:hypothetical protein n=1 Tax=Mesoflavibacter zeaxanthinifaciens TaxID=393060 RepID=UPI0004807486|nr:hypothetical protein [Mesoflavibacter zeaxanthinifaciens]